MSVAPPLPDRDAGLAAAARLLAAWWSRPTREELGRWGDAWEQAGEIVELLGLPHAGVDELRESVAGADPDVLLEEYERLFVGPGRTPCPPYESPWRTDAARREQGQLMAASGADVQRIYRELGLRVRSDAHELPEHLVVEWEALAYALEHGFVQASAELAGEHLARWIPAFCAAVAAETEQPFYGALARLTTAWTTAVAP